MRRYDGNLSPMTQCGTPLYMAPELQYNDPTYTSAVDMWAIGVLFYRLISKQWPFYTTSFPALCQLLQQPHPTITELIPMSCHNLIDRLLAKDPTQRITAEQALSHPFFLEVGNFRRQNRLGVADLEIHEYQWLTKKLVDITHSTHPQPQLPDQPPSPHIHQRSSSPQPQDIQVLQDHPLNPQQTSSQSRQTALTTLPLLQSHTVTQIHSDTTQPVWIPQNPSHVVPQNPSHVVPQNPSHVVPQTPPHVVPQNPSHVVPQTPSHVVPQTPPHVVPQNPSYVVSQTLNTHKFDFRTKKKRGREQLSMENEKRDTEAEVEPHQRNDQKTKAEESRITHEQTNLASERQSEEVRLRDSRRNEKTLTRERPNQCEERTNKQQSSKWTRIRRSTVSSKKMADEESLVPLLRSQSPSPSSDDEELAPFLTPDQLNHRKRMIRTEQDVIELERRKNSIIRQIQLETEKNRRALIKQRMADVSYYHNPLPKSDQDRVLSVTNVFRDLQRVYNTQEDRQREEQCRLSLCLS
ncbi:putative Protein kinase domain containing protein [Blattamonas nauphoetae]|uniref:Protein kinase domain-containing protein n=1 Tax=Blattamonas nauphoetae TaxID=2049346 RepID=A0ABQ9X3G7_9EUKA|nr:putative Protein kinase domain containing protein [Blattamonas nauphoetae]